MTNDDEQRRILAPSECPTETCSGWRVRLSNTLIFALFSASERQVTTEHEGALFNLLTWDVEDSSELNKNAPEACSQLIPDCIIGVESHTFIMRWITLLPAVVTLCFSLAGADPATDQETATNQLLVAVDNNDPQAVKVALKAGAVVNGSKGPTSLFKAVEYKKDEEKAYEVVEGLLTYGADINAKGPDGDSVFQEVMMGKALCSPKVTALLADYHPELTYRNSSGDGVVAMSLGRGPVFVATKDSQGKSVEVADWYLCARKFLEAGAPVDEANRDGVTPLMRLSQESLIDDPSPIDFIKVLLAKGADPERRDKQGKSAIDRAIAPGDYDLLLLLDAKGAHRDAYDAVKKKVLQRQLSLAVHDAIYNEAKSAEAMSTIKKLLKEGTDPNAKGFYYSPTTIFQESLIESNSPTKGRRIEVVKYLLDHGADPNQALSDGTVPLEMAIHQPEIFALLQAHGAKLSRNLELAHAASSAEIEDIQEATFRHQFRRNASGQQGSAKVYFLSIVDDKTGKEVDPSATFLKRFAGNQPRVGGVSECKASAEKGVLDIRTGEQGLIFSVDAIRWISETEVEVSGG